MSDDTGAEPTSAGASALASLQERGATSSPLADHPQMQAFFGCWLDTFLFKGTVDPRLRELAILRILWRCDRRDEWANHYRLARQAGVTDDDIVAIRTGDPHADLDGEVALVVRAADDVVDVGHLTPQTYADCAATFTDPTVLFEFVYLVAGYRMIAAVSQSRPEGPPRPGAPVWPPDGVGPAR